MKTDAKGLRSRNRRALGFAGGVLVSLVAWRWAGRPLSDALLQTGETLSSERRLLHGELALIRQSASLEPAWVIASEHLISRAPRLFSDRNNLHGGQALVAYLYDVGATAGVASLQISEPETATDSGGLLRIAAEVEAQVDLEGALTMLAEIESGKKLVRVAALDLRLAPDSPPAADGPPEHLVFRFRAEAYALSPDALAESRRIDVRQDTLIGAVSDATENNRKIIAPRVPR